MEKRTQIIDINQFKTLREFVYKNRNSKQFDYYQEKLEILILDECNDFDIIIKENPDNLLSEEEINFIENMLYTRDRILELKNKASWAIDKNDYNTVITCINELKLLNT